MSNTLGRISGQMLKANLERFGVDLAFENDLLYLDVNTGKVGMKTSTVPRDLTLDGDMATTNLIVDAGLFQVGDVIIDGSTGNISTVGNVPITFDPATDQISLSILKTPNIVIDNSTIQTTESNSNLELRISGNGRVEFGSDDSAFTDTLVQGNLHTVGDVTLDGTISFGDSSLEDAVSVNGEIGSDIRPTVNSLYDLGSPTKKWLNVHSQLIRGDFLTTTNFSVPGISTISARPGNTYYVSSAEGKDTNVGNHQMGPFRTVKHALSQATAGDMVYIYAGDYEEYFPLTVPKGVTVQGEGIRSTKIYPHTSNNDKDAFLLNGETTVENLTVADFYYNSTNDTGYAFRFVNNFQVDSRSPYIRNISVITRSDSSLESAGRGALVDGSVATQYSKEASMLFHSVTFITPGSTALFMKNGVRVEWLNSFTYFANRGLYAVNGAFGRLTPDGSTIKYGAELRSIGSANVYGNIGAEADGNQCLMYLINHNFAYIGAGTDVENDPTLVDQPKETIEVSGGKIYYQSSDQGGDFRVGEAFVVEQQTGFITANGIGGGAQGASSISFSDGVNNTEIDASSVDTGNVQLTQNNINTVGGDLNVTPASGQTTLDSNVTVQDTLTVDGDMVVTGAISFGDSTQQGASTTFSFNAPVSINLEPTFTKSYDIGSDTFSWKNVYSVRYTSNDINIFQNKIYTTVSSSSLELDAAGTGRVVFNSPLIINNNFTVSDTSLQNVGITGSLLHTGDLTQTGNKVVTGDYTLSGALSLNDIDVPFDGISINGNRIETTESNSNLELHTSGNASVIVPNNNLRIIGDTTVQDVFISNTATITGTLSSDEFLTDSLQIFQNNITGITNADIELRTIATGIVPSSITSTATISRFEFQPGSDYNQSVSVLYIDTTDWDISGQTFPQYLKGTNTVNGEYFLIEIDNPTPSVGDQYIYDVTQHVSSSASTITINQSDLFNLELGTVLGDIGGPTSPIILDENVDVTQDLTANTGASITFSNTDVNGNVTLTGPANLIGNTQLTGELVTSGDITADSLFLDNISIDNNVITTTESNSDLELRANGTGKIVTNNPVTVENTIEIKGALNFNSLTAQNSVSAGQFYTDQILIQENFFTTTSSNGPLELRASSTGKILIPNNNVQIDNNLTVSGDTTLQNLSDRQESSASLDFTVDNPNPVGTFRTDSFSENVKADGNYAIASAREEDTGTNSGKAYIIDTTTGNITQTLDNPNAYGTSNADNFGIGGVDISGNYAIVGAPLEDSAGGLDSGKAYIFDVATGNLVFTIDNPNANQSENTDYFGTSVAIDGNYAIVGAPYEDITPTFDFANRDNGAVYIFTTATGDWTDTTLVHTIFADGNSAFVEFGRAVDISGTTAVVGAPLTSAPNYACGAISIIDVTTGNITHTINDPDGTSNNRFGSNVAVHGNYVVACPTLWPYYGYDDINGDIIGRVYIFDATTGSLLDTLDKPNYNPADNNNVFFGNSVDLNDKFLVVGMPGQEGGTNESAVFVYDVNTRELLYTFNNPNPVFPANNRNDAFGLSVSVSGNTIIAGSLEDEGDINSVFADVDGTQFLSGKAYIYSITDEILPVVVPVDLNITGVLSHTGNRTQVGNLVQTGNYNLFGNTELDGYLQLADIRFETNYVSSTLSNSDLELRASGTGKVTVSNTNVSINENLVVVGDIFTTNANITNTLSFDRLEQNEIILDNNYITTSTSNTDLELRASGTGSVLIDDNLLVENNVNSNNLIVPQTVVTSTTQINGNVLQNGNTVRNGITTLNSGIIVNDSLQFENIKIDDNLITTTESNSDLELRASGTGQVLFDTDVTVNRNIEVLGDVNLTGDFTVSRINFNSITDGNILIDDNFITTTLSNSDLELRANGTGILLLDSNDLEAGQDLSVLGNTDIKDTNINGTVLHNGNAVHTGNFTNNGKVNIGKNFVTNSTVSFSNIQLFNNVIRTSESNGDFELRADGLGKIVTESETRFDFDLDVSGNTILNDATATSITADVLQTTDDIRISNSTIETTVSNSNLEFRSSVDVRIDDLIFEDNKIKSLNTDQNIVLSPAGNLDLTNTNIIVPRGPSNTSPSQPGELRYNTTEGKFAGYVSGTQLFGGVFSSDLETSVTASNSRFFKDNGTINFVVNNVDIGHIDSNGINIHGLKIDQVTINGNTVSSIANNDINITPNGTGTTVLDDTTISTNAFTNQNATDPMTLATTQNGYVKFNSTTGVVMPTGDISQRPLNPEVGEIRYNNQQGTPEVWNGTTWATWAGNSVTATEAEIDEISNIFAILLG